MIDAPATSQPTLFAPALPTDAGPTTSSTAPPIEGSEARSRTRDIAPGDRPASECPPDLAQRILAVTQALAHQQAMNPDERDAAGFNNADYPIGFVLAARGDVREAALLLSCYRRQVEGHGLMMDDLVRAAPELGASSNPAISLQARAALRSTREAHAGKLEWFERDGKLYLNGVGLAASTRRALGPRQATTGWQLNVTDGWKLIQRLEWVGASIERQEALATILGPRPAGLEPERVAQPQGCVVSVKRSDTIAALQWTEPFSKEGTEVRNVVKTAGARFNGSYKTWDLPIAELPKAAYLVSLLPKVELSEAMAAEADTLPPEERSRMEERWDARQAGIQILDVVRETPDAVFVKTMERHDRLYEAMRSLGIRWTGAYEVPRDRLADVLPRLAEIGTLDTAALAPHAKALAEQLAAEAARLAVGGPVLPDLTHTPTGRKLFQHQIEDVRQMVDPRTKGVMNGNEMGLGKSLEAALAAHLRFPSHEARFLIICPAFLKLNWRDEIYANIGEREEVHVVEGRSGYINKHARWNVVNYDIVKDHIDGMRALQPNVTIVDEAHFLRNDTAQRTKVLIRDAKKVDGRREEHDGFLCDQEIVWLLSGTFMSNRPKDLFNSLHAIKHPLGRNFFTYAQRYCGAVQHRFGWDFSGATNLTELGEKLRPVYIRRLKKDCLDLPAKMIQPVRVELSPAAMKQYAAAIAAALNTPSANRAQQLVYLNAAKMATALAKAEFSLEDAAQIVETGGKVAIFTGYYEVLDMIEQQFGDKVVRLDGSVPNKERHRRKDAFQQDDRIQVLAGQTQACGVGVTLTAAQTGIINDYPWVPGDLDQVEDRLHRIGQRGTVTIRRMEAECTFDPVLREILGDKSENIDEFNRAAMGRVEDVDPAAQAERDARRARGQESVIARLMAAIAQSEGAGKRRKRVALLAPDAAPVAVPPSVVRPAVRPRVTDDVRRAPAITPEMGASIDGF